MLVVFAFFRGYTSTIYVSNAGDDIIGNGSLETPLKTIQKAVDMAVNGDEIVIRGGIYRESIKVNIDNLTIKNYLDEYVLITGLAKVEGWEQYKGNIYKAQFNSVNFDSNMAYSQLFVNGKFKEPARYPNEDGDKLSSLEWMSSETKAHSAANKAKVNLNETFPTHYWDGGYYVGTNTSDHNAFNAAKGKIDFSNGNTLECSDICLNWNLNWKSSVGIGRGYILYHLNALDIPGEWAYKNNELYYMVNDGQNITELNIEVRVLLWLIDISNRTDIKLNGLNFKAGLANLENATNCVIDKCTFRYLSPFSTHYSHPYGIKTDGSNGIYVSGIGNTISNSYFGRSYAACITLEGQNNVIENCIIEDGNWTGERMGLINLYGKGNQINRNTIRKAGRAAIDGGNQIWINKYGSDYIIQGNHLYDAMQLSTDGGAFYTNHKSNKQSAYANAKICYNWISTGTKGDIFGKIRVGVYIDDNTSGVLVHHNVIYNTKEAVRTNQANQDIRIFNNTVMNCFMSHARWIPAPNISADIITCNNISGAPATPFIGTENSNNYYSAETETVFEDWQNFDFRLRSGSGAIDYGIEIEGITDGYLGEAPDAGAYEYGKANWRAGADWDINDTCFIDEPEYVSSSLEPINLSAMENSDGHVILNWDENGIGTDYKILINRCIEGSRMSPFDTIENKISCYTDTLIVPGEIYYYTVQVVKSNTLAPQSNEVRIRMADNTMIDYADNFEKLDDYSSNIIIGMGSPELFGGESFRYRRTDTSPAYLQWKVRNIKEFSAILFFEATQYEKISFYVSKDAVTWQEVVNVSYTEPAPVSDGWKKMVISAQNIPGDNWLYLKLKISGGTKDYVPQLGSIYINEPYLITNLESPAIQDNFNVYPTCTNGKVNLTQNSIYQVFTLTGVMLLCGKGNEIDLTNMPDALYVIKCKGQSFKIIKH